ncbi:ImmA/IrrE family metallo-endopeptidase [Pedobacter nototheniae]|uniref:ImmA/IrrE family metallo-endopeptidase n=1 Tax=Pedobacter nototheniae TaxID=2488994 RepID=UPI00103DEDDC|nr:ImmA/IrrE family metallo-endopeptidase [Pedobacter nototheniae]
MLNDQEIIPTEKLKHLFNTPDEKSAVKVICRQILASLNLKNAPIPLKPICKKFNLKVQYNTVVKKEDSFLKLSPDGFEIEISKLKNWRRNRFTIAHELTHLIIFNAINTPINSFDRKQHDEIEKLCDIGASELLINEIELEKNLVEHGINATGLKKIYDKFMVSYDALFVRLSEHLDANILIWRNHARHELEKMEYRVYRHFPKYKFATKSIWLPNGCTVRHISPNPFENFEKRMVLDDFNVIMNDKTTECSALTFLFPHSRNSNNNLPIFDELIVNDELTYDDCFVMIIFKDKKKFKKVKTNYCKNDN